MCYITPLDLRVDVFTVYSTIYNIEEDCSMLWLTLCLINNEYNKLLLPHNIIRASLLCIPEENVNALFLTQLFGYVQHSPTRFKEHLFHCY